MIKFALKLRPGDAFPPEGIAPSDGRFTMCTMQCSGTDFSPPAGRAGLCAFRRAQRESKPHSPGLAGLCYPRPPHRSANRRDKLASECRSVSCLRDTRAGRTMINRSFHPRVTLQSCASGRSFPSSGARGGPADRRRFDCC